MWDCKNGVKDERRPLRDSGETGGRVTQRPRRGVAGAMEGGARNGVDGRHRFSSVVHPKFDEEQPQSSMEPCSSQGHEKQLQIPRRCALSG